MNEAEYCSVANDSCKNPAGYRVGMSGFAWNPDPARTRAHCVRCGEHACANCRSKVKGEWVCDHCKAKS